MIALAVLSTLLIFFIAYREWQHGKERQQVLDFAERMAKDAHDERKELATRIQAPEAAPFIIGKTPEKQYVTEGNEEQEGWEAIRSQMNGD